MDVNSVSSSPGGRMEAARSSSRHHASRAPFSSSPSSAPDPPPRQISTPCFSSLDSPPRTSTPSSSALGPPPSRAGTPSSSAPDRPQPQTPTRSSAPDSAYNWISTSLEDPSASASREWSNHRDREIDVHLMTRDNNLETAVFTFLPSQTVQDLKEYFEKHRDACSAENMVVYHDGTKLGSETILETLDLKRWKTIVLTYEEDISQSIPSLAPIQEGMVDEGLMLSLDDTWETTNEGLMLSLDDTWETTNLGFNTVP